jgi:putative tricarboxylic transport membrane protein
MNSDRWSYGFLFLLALFGLISAWRMPLGQLQEPGPGFFPLAIATLLLAFALLGFVTARSAAPEASRPGAFWGDLKPPAKIVLSMGLAILVFEGAGFLLSISFFLALLFFWVSRYPWWKAVALGLIGGSGGWFLFVRILGVAMPEGLLGF